MEGGFPKDACIKKGYVLINYFVLIKIYQLYIFLESEYLSSKVT
jgi:hypothetical protein